MPSLLEAAKEMERLVALCKAYRDGAIPFGGYTNALNDAFDKYLPTFSQAIKDGSMNFSDTDYVVCPVCRGTGFARLSSPFKDSGFPTPPEVV